MEKQVKITSGRSLSKAIDAIMKESIKAALYQNGVEEREKQKKMLGEEDDDLFDSKDSDKKEEKPSKTMDSEKEKLKTGEVSADDVIEKLNTIRSGRSFKDEDIFKKMSEYIESLSKAERIALLAFLKGLSQIVSGEVEPSAALDPSDKPGDIKMKKGEEVQKKSVKPNVIKTPEKEKPKKKPTSSEDTTGPVPITPKKK